MEENTDIFKINPDRYLDELINPDLCNFLEKASSAREEMGLKKSVVEETGKEKSEKNLGKVIIISSPSGGGKSTIVKKLFREGSLGLSYGVSYTTRPRRKDEIDGVSYIFISRVVFLSAVQSGQFLEWDEYAGELYGTKRSTIENCLKREKYNNYITELNTTGAKAIKAAYGDNCLTIFLLTPSYDELKKRLENRGTETSPQIQKRMEETEREMADLEFFDHVVMNEDIEKAYSEVKDIVKEFLNISKDE